MPWWAFAIAALYIGPPAGFARVYLGGLLVGITGRWLGGEGNSEACRAALAWGSVPQIASLALFLPAAALLGDDVLLDKGLETEYLSRFLALVGLLLAWLVIGIWAALLKWKCVGEVHGFSAWRGFLAMAIAWILVLTVIAGLVLTLVALDSFPSKAPADRPRPRDGSAPERSAVDREDPALIAARMEGRSRVGADRPSAVPLSHLPPAQSVAYP